MKNKRNFVKLIGLITVFSIAFLGCYLVGETECFDVSISTDGSEQHLRTTGKWFCAGKGFDRQTNVRSRNGTIYEICCKKDGII
jgi:hypothetical protein